MRTPPSPANDQSAQIALPEAEAPSNGAAAAAAEPRPAAVERWEQEGGGLAPEAGQKRPPKASSAQRKRKTRDRSIADYRARSAADLEQSGTMDSRKDRMQLEDSAAALSERADLLQRLNHSTDKRDALDEARRTGAPDGQPPRAGPPAADRPSDRKPPEPAVPRVVSMDDVLDRLLIEAAGFDEAHGGAHKFNNVRRYNNPNGANWTANFGARGGDVRLSDAVQLTYMRDALAVVQADMPQIAFEGRNFR